MKSHGIIILAAGASTRLGQPKQLLLYHGKSLIQGITNIALDVVEAPVVVVLGAHADLIRDHLKHLPAHVVYNPYWTNGIASSIRTGLMAAINLYRELDSVLFTVCDQPYVSPELLRDIISTRNSTKKAIVACTYDNTVGTPVLISKTYFGELLNIKGNEGARKVIQHHPESVQTISFPMGHVDIDTLQDYAALKS